MELFDESKIIGEAGCPGHHIFHADCLETWMEEQDTCPICREQIFLIKDSTPSKEEQAQELEIFPIREEFK